MPSGGESRSVKLLNLNRFERISDIMSCRESVFGALSKNNRLQDILKVSQHDALFLEAQVLLLSSKMSRAHGALQNALTAVTYLSMLISSCQNVGVNITAATHFESAQVLWEQGEMSTSVRMLQQLQSSIGLHEQSMHVGKPEVLAKLVITALPSVSWSALLSLNSGSSDIGSKTREAGRNYQSISHACYQGASWRLCGRRGRQSLP